MTCTRCGQAMTEHPDLGEWVCPCGAIDPYFADVTSRWLPTPTGAR